MRESASRWCIVKNDKIYIHFIHTGTGFRVLINKYVCD